MSSVGVKSATKAFQARTAEFREMYDVITDEMAEYTRGLSSPAARAWFADLTKRFEAEYWKWANAPLMISYLAHADKRTKLERLVLHMIIHINYDLPRVIANSLSANDVSSFNPREIYDNAEAAIKVAFNKCAGRRSIFGIHAWIPSFCNLFSKRWGRILIENMQVGVILQRETAYSNALVLLDAPSAAERLRFERSFWRKIEERIVPSADPLSAVNNPVRVYQPREWELLALVVQLNAELKEVAPRSAQGFKSEFERLDLDEFCK